MIRNRSVFFLLLGVLTTTVFAVAQQSAAPVVPQPSKADVPAPAAADQLRIGPDDELDVSVYGVPDLTQHLRVSAAGEVPFPLVGSIKIAGLTAEEAQAAIEKRLSDGGYVKNPHVTVFVREYNSEGVNVLGEVNHPGSYPALKARHLFDAFLAAGGLSQRAGNTVTISHKTDPAHPQVITLSSNAAHSVENNVALQSGDSVVVSRAGIVYVVGEVVRPGGFVIEGDGPMTASQVLAMAAGPTRLANLSHAQVLRRTPTGLETKELDLKKLLKAKSADYPLTAEDILFVPPSQGRMAAEKGANSALSLLTTLAIYRF